MFRQAKILAAGDALTPGQRKFVERFLGISLTSGQYEIERKPDAMQTQLIFANPKVWAIGKPKKTLLTPAFRHLIQQTLAVPPAANISSFTRAFLNQETVMGVTYKRSQKRRNSIVAYRPAAAAAAQLSFAEVHSFHWVVHFHQQHFVALVREVRRVDFRFVQEDENLTAPELQATNGRFFQVLEAL